MEGHLSFIYYSNVMLICVKVYPFIVMFFYSFLMLVRISLSLFHFCLEFYLCLFRRIFPKIILLFSLLFTCLFIIVFIYMFI
jgi:hypothetical protein